MKFGSLPLDQADGAVLAHSVRFGPKVFKKGRRLSAADIEALRAAGIDQVVVAKLGRSDIAEDRAAEQIAAALRGGHVAVSRPFTGRVNLLADRDGLLVLDAGGVDRLNRIDEAITVATLANHMAVRSGQMVATVKIIPFAVDQSALSAALALVREAAPLIGIAPFRARQVTLIQTRLPGVKETVLDKTVGVTAARLTALGGQLIGEVRCAHDVATLAARLKDVQGDLVLVSGASAITDRRDVLPAAIEAAGGMVEHFGMPVDPGNLLLLARLGDRPVLGLPGCARSPKLNGFDWVLERLFAGLTVTATDLTGMGVGGLLTEIPSRPQPRDPRQAKRGDGVAGLLLAAGQSTRMGDANKLLVDVLGKPMVVHAIDAMLGSKVDPVIVVTGHQADAVRAAIGDRPVRLVYNPDYAAGLSTSLKAGLDALPEDAAGVLVALGDMPMIRARDIDRLIAAFNPAKGRAICVPTVGGKRGNPVLFSLHYAAEMRTIEGDVGARHLIGAHRDALCEIEMDDDAALIDIDTREALAALARRPSARLDG